MAIHPSTYSVNCKECGIEIKIPDTGYVRFTCDNCGTTMETEGILITVIPQQELNAAISNPETIADDLYVSIHLIFELLYGCETTTSTNRNGYLDEIKNQISGLYEEIIGLSDKHSKELKAALKITFTYDRVFYSPRTLEVLLTALYKVLFGIGKQFNYVFIKDGRHKIYAEQLIKMHSHMIRHQL
jgi:hypothetical protein